MTNDNDDFQPLPTWDYFEIWQLCNRMHQVEMELRELIEREEEANSASDAKVQKCLQQWQKWLDYGLRLSKELEG